MDLPQPPTELPHFGGLHQRGRRIRVRSGTTSAQPQRVQPPGLSRDRRGSVGVQQQTGQLPEDTETPLLLGDHQPRHSERDKVD